MAGMEEAVTSAAETASSGNSPWRTERRRAVESALLGVDEGGGVEAEGDGDVSTSADIIEFTVGGDCDCGGGGCGESLMHSCM